MKNLFENQRIANSIMLVTAMTGLFSCGSGTNISSSGGSSASAETTSTANGALSITGYIGSSSGSDLNLADATPSKVDVYKYVSDKSTPVLVTDSTLSISSDETQITGKIPTDSTNDLGYKMVVTMSDGTALSAVLPPPPQSSTDSSASTSTEISTNTASASVVINSSSSAAAMIEDAFVANNPGLMPDTVSILKIAVSAVNGGISEEADIAKIVKELVSAQAALIKDAKALGLDMRTLIFNSAYAALDPATIKAQWRTAGSASSFNYAGPLNAGQTQFQNDSSSKGFNPPDIAQTAILSLGDSSIMRGFVVTQVDMQLNGPLASLSASQASSLRTSMLAQVVNSNSSSLLNMVKLHPTDPSSPFSSTINNGVAGAMANIDPTLQLKLMSDAKVSALMQMVTPGSNVDIPSLFNYRHSLLP